MMMRDALQAHLGNSMVAEQVAQGVNVQWWSEFAEQAGPLGQDVPPTASSASPRCSITSAHLPTARRDPSPLALARRLLPVVVAVPGRRRPRPLRARAADAVVRVLHGVRRLLRPLPRLAPFIALAYYVLFAVVHPMLLDGLFAELTRDVTVERTAFFVRLGLYAIFGTLLVLREHRLRLRQGARRRRRSPQHDRRDRRRRAIRATKRGGGRRRCISSPACLFVALLLIYAIAAPGAGSTGAGMWLGFADRPTLSCSGVCGSGSCFSHPKPRSSRAAWHTPATSRARRSLVPNRRSSRTRCDGSCQPANMPHFITVRHRAAAICTLPNGPIS